MHQILQGNGEIPSLYDNSKVFSFDEIEEWQMEQIIYSLGQDSISQANYAFEKIDYIEKMWLLSLTKTDWGRIKKNRSLHGISLPAEWIKMWRFVLKDPDLRNKDKASRNGRATGTYAHLWNLWSMDCLNRFLTPMEKELLDYVDQGLLYDEIGNIMLGKYGEEFWKPRKKTTTTTPSQVVNYFMYWKIPNDLARKELTEVCLIILDNIKKK